jgi:hypothetical protein
MIETGQAALVRVEANDFTDGNRRSSCVAKHDRVARQRTRSSLPT